MGTSRADYDFTGKVAIVTGAAGGIGRAVAERFYRGGAFVVIADIRPEAGSELAASLGERARSMPCDIGDPEAVNADAFHMATALLTGLERMATMATDPNFPTLSRLTGPPRPDHDPAIQALGLEVSSARLLELAIRDGRARARTGG